MAISPCETIDPERHEQTLEQLEVLLDAKLKDNFFSAATVEIKITGMPQMQFYVAEELVRRYRSAGWVVRWDGDCVHPYFYFRMEQPKRRRWWLLGWKL